MALYADIIEIVAPSQAAAGNKVDITIKVKNTYSAVISIMIGGALEYGVSPWPGLNVPENWANVNGGATYSFSASFIMPDRRVTIHAYSYWYGSDGSWYFDDEFTKSVEITAVSEPSILDFRIADFIKV
ncbi:hypothetical protein DA01_03085 [Dehalococcoides mccartyi]|uniref:Uncharacterized protein n=1 Tax=Dehalococcoides mccartyi TaxID=61435 RepID=A0A0V8M3S9_9CHLR|nr:hypothetical protein [Dehalococcoides mccartyi]KSV18406.1 hypothetical protein DA01_03085 [Dehalococcoides mccartyi]